MKIYTLWQMQEKNPDWIVIRSFGERTRIKKEFTKSDSIPQYLWEEDVKKWDVREIYNKTFLTIEI